MQHHFVPQFYLKGFVDPSSQKFPNPYLWVVDLQNKTLKRRGPKNIAKIAGFYDWEEAGDEIPSVEGVFSQIEGRVAPIISRIRENNFHMTLEDRYNLSNFLGFQITRTPFARSLTENRMRIFAEEWLHEFLQDEDRVRAKIESYIESKGDTDSELTAESIRRDFIEEKKFRIVPRSDHVLAGTLEVALKFAEIIFVETYWLFLLATGGERFFTSDHPVSVGKAKQINFGDGRIPEIEIGFPISPSCFLLLHQYKHLDIVEGVDFLDANKIEKVNRAMLRITDRYIFCSNEQQGKWVLGQ